jgi:putative ABC transport system ATP-binding protein
VAKAIALEARKVKKVYRLSREVSYEALRGVSLQVREGERVAIIGPSGSGKSTLLNVLGTLDRPTEGQVLVDGIETGRMTEGELARLRNKRLGFVFQNYGLIQRMSALENVTQPLIAAGLSRAQRAAKAGAILERVGLASRLHHRPAALSGGEQQRVAIARALVLEPSVLLADEPTGNLDTATGESVLKLLGDLHREFGITIVFVTHDVAIARAADRIVRIRDGRIEGEGLPPTAPPTAAPLAGRAAEGGRA